MSDEKLPTRVEVNLTEGKVRLDNIWGDLRPATEPAIETLGNLFGIAAKISGVTANLFTDFIDRMQPVYRAAMDAIPVEHRQRPPLRISSSVVEESVKCMQEDDLQTLFAKLLATASDDRHAGEAHPGFAKAIGQLTSMDAKLLKLLKSGSVLSAWGLEQAKVCSRSEYQMSAANLVQLGISEWVFDRADTWFESRSGDDFGRVKIRTEGGSMGNSSRTIRIEPDGLKEAAKKMAGRVKESIEKSHTRTGIRLTEYGKAFCKACISADPSESGITDGL